MDEFTRQFSMQYKDGRWVAFDENGNDLIAAPVLSIEDDFHSLDPYLKQEFLIKYIMYMYNFKRWNATPMYENILSAFRHWKKEQLELFNLGWC